MAKKKALITGITGQDGSYLSELLLSKDYDVFGIERRVAIEDQEIRKGRLVGKGVNGVNLIPADITNYAAVFQAISDVKPDEVYHLAAQSFVQLSFPDEFSTLDTNVMGTANVLNSIRKVNPNCRFYFAASSEMYGKVEEEPQTEKTRFHPRSPYGVSKVAGFYMTQNYREMGMFACSGILFNHESPRRGKEFVTRKITDGVAKIKFGRQKELFLGNLDTKRDWGFSGDYVRAMWLMLQQNEPDDYVIATNEIHTLEEFLELAFDYVGLDWKDYTRTDPRFVRPSDVVTLRGDYSKAKEKLGWKPEVKFEELIKMMVDNDLRLNLGESIRAA